jgi:hypothetical protein
MFKIARNTIYSTLAIALIAGAAPAIVMMTQPAMAQSAGGGGGGGGGGTGGNGNEANPALSFIISRAQTPGRGAAPSDIGGGQGCQDDSLRPDRCYTPAPVQRR